MPAAISLAFLVAETVYLIVKLPETKGWEKTEEKADYLKSKVEEVSPRDSAPVRVDRLKMIGWYHFAFLLFFSGVSRLEHSCRS